MKAAVALVGALAWVGCDCRAGLPELFYDGLDRACAAAPCGWEVEAGAFEVIATFHASERGARLAAGTSVVHEVDFGVVGGSEPMRGPALHVLIGCERDTQLVAMLEIEGDGTSEVATARVDARADEELPLRVRHVRLLAPDGSVPGDGRAVRVRLEVEGPGACTVDELRVVEDRVASDC